MEAEETTQTGSESPAKMIHLPKWDTSPNVGNFLFMVLVIVAVVWAIRRFGSKDVGASGQGRKIGPVVNHNREHPLPTDTSVSLLAPNDTVTVESPVRRGEVNVQVTSAEGSNLTVALPAGSDLAQTCAPGTLVRLGLDVGGAVHTVTAEVTASRQDRRPTLNLRLREPATLASLAPPTAEAMGEIPGLFAVIPAESIAGDRVPLADVFGKARAEIPAIVVSLRGNGATLRTQSPLPFHPGDLLLLHLMLPDDSTEVDLWGAIANVGGAADFHGAQIKVDFLTVSPELVRCLTPEELPQDLDADVIS